MLGVVIAVYEKGVLRPSRPLKLREHEAVRIQVLDTVSADDEGEQAVCVLVSAGMMRPSGGAPPPLDPVPDAERRALAERLGGVPGKPLSEIVIEARGKR